MVGFGAITTPSRFANQKPPLATAVPTVKPPRMAPFLADSKRKSLECQNVDEKTMGHRFAQRGIPILP